MLFYAYKQQIRRENGGLEAAVAQGEAEKEIKECLEGLRDPLCEACQRPFPVYEDVRPGRTVITAEDRIEAIPVEQGPEPYHAHDLPVVHGDQFPVEEKSLEVIRSAHVGDADDKPAAGPEKPQVPFYHFGRIVEMLDEASRHDDVELPGVRGGLFIIEEIALYHVIRIDAAA